MIRFSVRVLYALGDVSFSFFQTEKENNHAEGWMKCSKITENCQANVGNVSLIYSHDAFKKNTSISFHF